jgi:hypothetical protein
MGVDEKRSIINGLSRSLREAKRLEEWAITGGVRNSLMSNTGRNAYGKRKD